MENLIQKSEDYAKVFANFDELAALVYHLSSKECTAEHHTQMIAEIIHQILAKYDHGKYECKCGLWQIAQALEKESFTQYQSPID